MRRKKNSMNFTSYEQTLFSKYEIDEVYLQTGKQKKACLELLEKIDKNEAFDEKKLMRKIAEAFRGTGVHKKVASCMTVAALMITLQSTTAMAKASYSFTPSAVTAQTLSQALKDSSVVMDQDSLVDQTVVNQQPITNRSIHLVARQALKNAYTLIEDNGVRIDGDSDIAYYKKPESKVLNVIDTTLDGWEVLRDGIKEGEVLLLDREDNVLDTLLAKLEQMGQVDCINIISHGSSGKLIFENSEISIEQLLKDKDKWASIGDYVSQEGDIQLFGCNIAQGEQGAAFVEKLAEVTGADVAASINPTGAEEKGGDWKLEMVVGDVGSDLPFVKQALSNFDYLLASTTLTPYTFNKPDTSLKDSNFVVRGYANGGEKTLYQYAAITCVVMYDNTYATTGSANIRVSANGSTLKEFELQDFSFSSDYIFGNLQVIGYKVGGGSVLANKYINSSPFDKSKFSGFNGFADIPLTSFVIKWDLNSSMRADKLKLKSFTVNMPPTVSAVNISGIAQVGQLLTGSYTYTDSDADSQGTSTFKWYRSDDVAGIINKTVIATAVGQTYVLTPADLGKYISFEVTPIAATGLPTGIAVESSKKGAVVAAEAPPIASAVSVSGTAQVGQMLTGNYTYTDVNNDTQGASIFKWYRSDDVAGTINKTAIAAAVGQTYVLTAADLGKYISFEVTPIATTGTLTGTAVESSGKGAIVAAEAAPTASAVSISGTAQVGQTLTGNYTYADVNNDTQGTSTFKWYRSDDVAGTINKIAIAAAVGQTYVLTAADLGKYISFEVTPIATAGTLTGIAVESSGKGAVLVAEAAPTASAVSISGSAQVGQTLTGSYTYTDVNNDTQGISTFKWYRSDDAIGTNKTVIGAATLSTYILVGADVGKYISFEVTPVASTGTTTGIAVESAKTGAVVIAEMEPVASNVSITGIAQVGQTLTGSYDYADINNDVQGTSTFKWYRSEDASGTNKTSISGATSSTYILVEGDLGKYISFEVTPIASTGITTGVAIESMKTSVVVPAEAAPVASNVTITGTAQVGKTLTGSYDYADVNNDVQGTSAFKWYRFDDVSGANKTPISGATLSTYTLVEADLGKYIGFEVTPVASTGTTLGLAVESGKTSAVVSAIQLTYSIASIEKQTMIKKVVGYQAGSQETKTVGITKTGTGDLTNIRVELSGAAAGAFEITQPSATTLNNGIASTNFTVKAKDGLAIGNYMATVTILADNMTNVTFNVEQEIRIEAPSIPNIDFVEAGDKYVTIKWSGVKNASSYKVFGSTIQGSYGPEAAIVTNPISSTVSGSVYEAVYGYTFTNLTNGTPYYFKISSINAIGESQNSNEVSQTPKATIPTIPTIPSTDADSGSTASTAPSNNETGIIVIVNGKEYTAGIETVKTKNGEKQVQLIVNPEVINSKIEEIIKAQINLSQEQKKERNNRVEVPVKANGVTKLTATLTGDSINKMEENEFELSVKTEDIEYLIPAKEIDIDKVAKALGVNVESLKDISIDVKINKVNDQLVQQITKHAKENNYQIIFPPVDFTVVARTKSATGVENEVTISKFNRYVERIVEIPAGIDPNKITTGVVYNTDGTFAHIPTEVFKEGNKYFAKLSSLTNSSYSVISNPITVAAVEHHWSKEYVNDMASRLVIKDPESYIPDAEITRGEFAESITKAIGVYRSKVAKENQFTDVKSTDELADAITIAVEYGIISGYEDHTFRPNEKISREEAMAMYARAMDIVKLSEIDNNRIVKYKDASEVSSWAYNSVKKTISTGVFNGRSEDTIAPKETFTYAEAATAIRNLLVESKLINK